MLVHLFLKTSHFQGLTSKFNGKLCIIREFSSFNYFAFLRWLNSLNIQISISPLKHSSCLKFHFPISILNLLQVNSANSVLAKVQRYLHYSNPVHLRCQSFLWQYRTRSSILLPPSFLPYQKIFQLFFGVEILKSLKIWVVYFAIKKTPSPFWTWSRKLPLHCVKSYTWYLSSLHHFKKNMPANSKHIINTCNPTDLAKHPVLQICYA